MPRVGGETRAPVPPSGLSGCTLLWKGPLSPYIPHPWLLSTAPPPHPLTHFREKLDLLVLQELLVLAVPR